VDISAGVAEFLVTPLLMGPVWDRLPYRYCTMPKLLLNKQQQIWGGIYIH